MKNVSVALSLLAAVVLSSGCAPASEHHRLDFRVRADGSCVLRDQTVACKEAGLQALALYPADHISAVLFIDPTAPAASAQVLRAALLEAHVTHIQLGDTAHQAYLATKGVQF